MTNENQQKKVSIIIPTHNRCMLLMETLLSVKKQTYANWECIIVDDNSSDATKMEVSKIMQEDNRFRYLKRDFVSGAASCRNFGFNNCSGEYIQFLDDDDLISENKLEMQVRVLNSYADQNIFTTCDWDFLWEDKLLEKKLALNGLSEYTRVNYFNELFKSRSFIPIHTFLFHRNLLLEAGLWNEKLSLNDDAEFICRVILKSLRLINTENCYVLYRQYAGIRISVQNDEKSFQSLLLSFKLMIKHLEEYGIQSNEYFRWKLLSALLGNWHLHKDTIKREKKLFKKIGINLAFINYYLLKKKVYNIIYPMFKKFIKTTD